MTTRYETLSTYCDPIVAQYEIEYRKTPAFWGGFERDEICRELLTGFEQQAYDRGAECRMRCDRLESLIGD